MTNNDRLAHLRVMAQNLDFDLAWANANQTWLIIDYRPYAPETAELRSIKNDLDGVEEFLVANGIVR